MPECYLHTTGQYNSRAIVYYYPQKIKIALHTIHSDYYFINQYYYTNLVLYTGVIHKRKDYRLENRIVYIIKKEIRRHR